MIRLKCEACGGSELIKDGDYFICQHCRAKYTPAAAEKLVIQIDGAVCVDGIAGVANLLERAEEYARAGDEVTAGMYFNKVLDNDPLNPAAREFFFQQEKRRRRAARTGKVILLVILFIVFLILFVACTSFEVFIYKETGYISGTVGVDVFYLLVVLGLGALIWRQFRK